MHRVTLTSIRNDLAIINIIDFRWRRGDAIFYLSKKDITLKDSADLSVHRNIFLCQFEVSIQAEQEYP